jgi:hypothetical protein
MKKIALSAMLLISSCVAPKLEGNIFVDPQRTAAELQKLAASRTITERSLEYPTLLRNQPEEFKEAKGITIGVDTHEIYYLLKIDSPVESQQEIFRKLRAGNLRIVKALSYKK